jgi:hypothetical protein
MAVRQIVIFLALGFAVSACQGSRDRDLPRRLLHEPVRDYYYGTTGSPTENDSDFTYGWDIDGS